jgi:hypothetical protein
MTSNVAPVSMHLVRLPPQLAALSETSELSLAGETAWEVLQALRAEMPLVAQELLDVNGRPFEFLAVVVNGRRQTREQIRSAELEAGATVMLVLAAAGG